MKKVLSLMMVLILVMSVSLIACGGDDEEETTGETTPAKTTPAETTPTKTVTGEPVTPQPTLGGDEGEEAGEEEEEKPTPTKETPSAGGGDDLSAIFEEMPKCVQATLITLDPDAPEMEQKIWIKEKKMRSEMTVEGGEAVIITDLEAGVMYTNTHETDSWVRMTVDPGDIQMMDKEAVLDCNPEIIGSDTYDGKACTVVEYKCGDILTKTWIWKEKNWPLKEEITDPEGRVVTVIYKDISFNCAADSLFELPAGTRVIDLDEMMEGMGGEGMPQGGFELPEGFPMPQ